MKTYKQLGITKEQRANLKKLADYLSSGKLKARFDMNTYASRKNWNDSDNCGSVGCAVGHGPYAGVAKSKEITWNRYAEDKFGADPYITGDKDYYSFLFSDYWKTHQPTAKQAAKRIYLLLEKGLPSNWHKVRNGDEKRFKYEQNK